MQIELYLLDTFTTQLFRGNPTPISCLEAALTDITMQQLTNELQMPVMAFVLPPDKESCFPIRYFTKSGEIMACGHATLGAMEVLYKEKGYSEIRFRTREGVLLESRRKEGLNFIRYPKYLPQECVFPFALLEMLGGPQLHHHFYSPELKTLFLELANPSDIREIRPDFQEMVRLAPDLKELVIMSRSEEMDQDVILRSFCPWIGIDEDPVTGSIHSVLGPYWQEQLLKDSIRVYQASERGGELWVQSQADSVEIGGASVLLMRGKLEL